MRFYDMYLHEIKNENKGKIELLRYLVMVMELGSLNLKQVIKLRTQLEMPWKFK
jgi:hypothetical protein